MIVRCEKCKQFFDDEFRTTICPHETFPANDGHNNFSHHPESYLSAKCPNHPDEPELGYLEASSDAERRLKKGEQQYRCGRCGLWIWAEHMKDFTGAVSEAWQRRIDRLAQREARRAQKRNAP